MIYFKLNDDYCSAEYINEQLAEQVTYITKEEFEEGSEKRFFDFLLEIRPEEEQ